jgi:hypothetical protein
MRGARPWSGWGPGSWALAVLAVLVVGAVIVLATGEQRTSDRSRSATGTTTLRVVTTTSAPVATTVAEPPPASSTSTITTTTTTRPPTITTTTRPRPTTTPICGNSQDPACGPFRWDPQPPPNQPLTVSVTVSPVPAVAGEVVSFHVVAEDPDGQITGQTVEYGDGSGEGADSQPQCAAAHGPWSPPAGTPDRVERTYQHTYARPGSYTVVFRYRSFGPCPDPAIYGNAGHVTVPVVISSSS